MFGIMAARFQVVHKAINVKVKNIEKIVMACCALHNFLRRKIGDHYTPTCSLDIDDIENGTTQLGLRPEPNTLTNIQKGFSRHAANNAKCVRESFMRYFNNDGAVQWQNKFIYN